MADPAGTHRQFSEGFEEFFQRATGHSPYPWQSKVGSAGLPDYIDVPTGGGKTHAVVLSFLHARMRGQAGPRRLVLIMPRRVLCSQTEVCVRDALQELGLEDEVDVHVLMGGGRVDRTGHRRWREDLHRTSIVIGTIDAVVSAVLNRAYLSTRSASVIDFALMVNDAHWVVDEGHLSPQSVATLRQVDAFRRRSGSYGESGLTVMSATMTRELLHTVDNSEDGLSVVSLSEEDRTSSMAPRLEAARRVQSLAAGTEREVADAVAAAHVEGSFTLVMCNTVETARGVHQALMKYHHLDDTLLVHSRFRGAERARQLEELERREAHGGIVVSTQCLEAGVDVDARTLVTEASPLPSFAQRVGRCNRRGLLSSDEATVLWFDQIKPKASPYDGSEVQALKNLLLDHEGSVVTADVLRGWRERVPAPDVVRRIIRRRDFDQLFDTTPDLAGDDIDIRPWISPDDDTDVAVAWLPDDELTRDALRLRTRKSPPDSAVCPVSLSMARTFLKRGVTAAAFRPELDSWQLLTPGDRVRPKDVLLVAASSGGYTREGGFDPAARTPVALVESEPDSAPDADGTEEDPGAISESGEWITLERHLQETRAQIAALISSLGYDLGSDVEAALLAAGYFHDVGKAWDVWQQVLAQDSVPEGGPWAKSPFAAGHGRLPRVSGGRRGLRHEVVSALMLLSPQGREILEAAGVSGGGQFLVAYLVGSHHGKLRVSARDPRRDGHTGDALFGLRPDDSCPAVTLTAAEFAAHPLDLNLLTSAGNHGWTARVQELISEWGPFRLAMFEAVVRMADWRASGARPVCHEESR